MEEIKNKQTGNPPVPQQAEHSEEVQEIIDRMPVMHYPPYFKQVMGKYWVILRILMIYYAVSSCCEKCFAQTPPFTVEAFYGKPDEMTVCIHNHSNREMVILSGRGFSSLSFHSANRQMEMEAQLQANDSMRVLVRIPKGQTYHSALSLPNGYHTGVLTVNYTFNYVTPPADCVWEKEDISMNIVPYTGNSRVLLSTIPMERLSGDSVYEDLMVPPQFEGGGKALLEYIQGKAAHYEVSFLEEEKITQFNRIAVRIVIEKDGTVSHVYPVFDRYTMGKNPKAVKAAVEIISGLPRFIPAKLRGKAVRSYYMMYVTFRVI